MSKEPQFLQHALDLAAKGFKVFPYWPIKESKCSCRKSQCPSPGKHPAIRHFPRLATTNPNQIRQWWIEDPNRGIGVSPESLLIIDVDGPDGHEALHRLEAQFGRLPKTYRVNSGNSEPDHYQLWYRCPDGYRVKNGPLSARIPGFDSIDIKSGGGGQVAGPGNLHKSGGRYHWDGDAPDNRDDLTEAPFWLTDAMGLVDEGWEPSRKPKPKKAPKKAPEDTYFEPGSDGEILLALQDRWPILEADTRRGIMTKAVAYLLATRKLTPPRSIVLLSQHLQQYCDNYNADLESAIDDMEGMVHSLHEKILSGGFSTAIDHDRLAAQQELHPVLKEFLDHLSSNSAHQTKNQEQGNYSCNKNQKEQQPRPPYAYGGRHLSSSMNYSRLSRHELMFLETILLRYQYEVFYHQNFDEFCFVESQIINMMQTRFEEAIGRTKYKELKNKFFGGKKLRGGKRTPVLELFRCISPGRFRGEPSRYTPIGIPQLPRDLELDDVRTRKQLDEERGKEQEEQGQRIPPGSQVPRVQSALQSSRSEAMATDNQEPRQEQGSCMRNMSDSAAESNRQRDCRTRQGKVSDISRLQEEDRSTVDSGGPYGEGRCGATGEPVCEAQEMEAAV